MSRSQPQSNPRHLPKIWGLFLLVLLLSLPGWGAPLRKVTLQLKWYHQFQFAGYYMAQARGLYAAQGLEVEFLEANTQRMPLPAVESGQAEFGVSDMEVFKAYLEGRPLVALGVTFQHSPNVLLALRGSGIHRPSDLAGRRVMFQGGQGLLEAQAMLKAEGINLDKVQARPHSWNLDDLIEGRVDAISAYSTNEPFLLKKRGFEPVQLRPSDYGVDFYGDLLFTTRSMAEQNPALVEAFRKASFQGWEQALANPEEAITLILGLPGVRGRGLTVEKLRYEADRMRELILPGLVDMGHMNPGRLMRIAAQSHYPCTPTQAEQFAWDPPPPPSRVWIRAVGFGALALMLLTAVVSLWILQLRRTVRLRTAELEESRERLRQILDSVDAYIFIKDLEGRYVYANRRVCTLFGLSGQEIVGRCDDEFFSPESLAEIRESDRPVLTLGQAVAREEQSLKGPDGLTRTYWAVKIPLRDGSGKLIGLCGTSTDITERKWAEEALRHSAAQLRTLVDALPDLVWMKDPDGVYLSCNARFERFFGATQAEILGRTDYDFLPRELADCFRDHDRRAMAAGKSLMNEEEITFADDGHREILETVRTPVLGVDGQLLGVLGIGRDITQRKAYEARLEQAQELMAHYLSVAEVMLVALDVDAKIMLLNRKGYEVLGYEEGELTGRDWFKVCLPAEESEAVFSVYRRIVTGDQRPVEDYENHIVRKDGSRRLIAWHNSFLRDKDGQPIGTLSSGEDITERRRGEIALRESEERLRGIFEASDAGILLVSPKGFVEFANLRMAELFGMPLQALIGTPYPELLHPSEQTAGDTRMRQLIQGEICSVSLERHYLRADGRDFWGHLSGRRIENPDGSLKALVGVITDITEQRRMAQEKEDIENHLQQAQKMESLGNLAGGVAHDMNNVLGAILGLASAQLEQLPPGHTTRQTFETIANAAMRGGKMVKGLLNFARQSPAEERELDLNAVIREEVQLLERTTLAKVHLEVHLAEDLPAVRGDVSALTHAIMNLCVNAVDAMPEGGVLRLQTRRLGAEQVEILVEDTGSGMSPEVLARAMDPFFTTKEVGKGTGLGLSMVYSTMKAHQGEMDLESEPGQGTRVRLRLPAHHAEVANSDPGEEPGGPPPAGGRVVLLVDDDELVQQSTEAVLEALGHQPRVVSSGEAGLALLEAGFRPDLVILDMNMPGLGGRGTLPRIRALAPELPVLLATGRADKTALDLVEAHPRVALLSKPFSLRELQARLGEFLG